MHRSSRIILNIIELLCICIIGVLASNNDGPWITAIYVILSFALLFTGYVLFNQLCQCCHCVEEHFQRRYLIIAEIAGCGLATVVLVLLAILYCHVGPKETATDVLIMDIVAAFAYAVEWVIKWRATLTQEEPEQQMPNAQNLQNVQNVQSPLIVQTASYAYHSGHETCGGTTRRGPHCDTSRRT